MHTWIPTAGTVVVRRRERLGPGSARSADLRGVAHGAQLVPARLTDPQRRLERDDLDGPPLRRAGGRLDRIDQQLRGAAPDLVPWAD